MRFLKFRELLVEMCFSTSTGVIPCSFMKKLRNTIPNFAHLETRGWFHCDYQLQADLLCLVDNGYANKINIFDGNFHSHIDKLLHGKLAGCGDATCGDAVHGDVDTRDWVSDALCIESMMHLPIADTSIPCSFIRKFRIMIPNFISLEACDWFQCDDELQDMLMYLVDFGYAEKIFIHHEDFYSHIDELCKEADACRLYHDTMCNGHHLHFPKLGDTGMFDDYENMQLVS